MRYSLLAIPLAIGMACSAIADDQPAKSTSPTFKPRLSGIMSVTQFLQYKVWYAGRTENWALADYEEKRLKDAFQDAIKFYPGLAQADMSIMENPAAQVDAAIKNKNSAAFVSAFVEMTKACNACHQSQGYGFIVISVPKASPHRNQIFTPEQ